MTKIVVFYDLFFEVLSLPISQASLLEALKIEGRRFTYRRLRFRYEPSSHGNGRHVFMRIRHAASGSATEATEQRGAEPADLVIAVFLLDDGRSFLTWSGPIADRMLPVAIELPETRVRIPLLRHDVTSISSETSVLLLNRAEQVVLHCAFPVKNSFLGDTIRF